MNSILLISLFAFMVSLVIVYVSRFPQHGVIDSVYVVVIKAIYIWFGM